MVESLAVHLGGHHIADLRRLDAENYVLEYLPEWAQADDAIPLSLSMPLANGVHRGRVVYNFIDNLLPDNADVRQRWATDIGLDTVEPYFLLRAYGHDVAGAASFLPPDIGEAGNRRLVDTDDIAERIRRLRVDDTAWHDARIPATGQFSLGGAQTKFSLARHGERWFDTSGADGSTHIFKPHVRGVPDGELVEYLVMKTAYQLGVPTARVSLFDHHDQHSLVVERFDRRVQDGATVRLHQEDMLQALGRPRLHRFQRHGGPGADDIAGLLAAHGDPDSRRRYAAMLVFSWLVLSTDAHAKNFSVYLQPDGVTLTPLYDASSLLPYLGPDRSLDLPSVLARAAASELAVMYGASYRAGDVARFEIEHIARRSGMPPDELLAVAALQIISISDVMSDVASEMPARLQTDTIARTLEWMPHRARQAAHSLGIESLL